MPQNGKDPPPAPSGVNRRRQRHRGSSVRTKAVYLEQDDGEGNWLVSYADMMTLLVGFFIMISAFSTPNARKFEELKRQTSKAMGSSYSQPYQQMSLKLKDLIKNFQIEKEVKIEEDMDGIVITSKGTLFFDSGSAELKPKALQLMTQIADFLTVQAKGFLIVVEGHTDDAPYFGKNFASNWELSAFRAGTVVRLFEAKGFPHANLRPMGLADTQSLVPNRSQTGEPISANQAENRRIVIRVQKQLLQRTSK